MSEQKEPTLIEQIKSFILSCKGKTRLTMDEKKHLYGLYNQYYRTHEDNYNCDLCCIRIFCRLEKL